MAVTKWTFDSTHSEIGFKIKHPRAINITGRFDAFEGEAYTNNENFITAQIEIKIKATSVNTGNFHRGEYLRDSDFFDVTNYPDILFSSSEIEKIDNDNFLLHGNLTMKGIKRTVTLKVEYNGNTIDPWGIQRTVLHITGRINRNEFGFSFNARRHLSPVIGEEVTIRSEIQLAKQAAYVAA